ncbi:hypothetical protein ACQY1Q_05950 [Tenacibaculum sp. TC6]
MKKNLKPKDINEIEVIDAEEISPKNKKVARIEPQTTFYHKE